MQTVYEHHEKLARYPLAAMFAANHVGKNMNCAPIFKICQRLDWLSARKLGAYTGSDHDRRDGFIHFSTAAQVKVTAAKHFSGQHDLVLLAVDPAQLGDALKWEPSRGGDLFPHLYADMPADAVLSVHDLPWQEGGHRFPDLDGVTS